MTAKQRLPAHFVLKLIAKTACRPFTQTEWMGWSGCESADPQYGEFTKAECPFTGKSIDGYLVIDGDSVEVGYGFPGDDSGSDEPASYDFTLRD